MEPTDEDGKATMARDARDSGLGPVIQWLPVLVVILAAAAFAPGVASDYFFSDSIFYIQENKALQAVSLAEFWKIWQTPLFRDELLPLRDLVYRIEILAFGLEPIPYKVVNLLLFILCGLAVWTLVGDFLRRFRAGDETGAVAGAATGTAAAVTLVFLLSGLFGLISLRVFLRAFPEPGETQRLRLRPLAAATLLFTAALMSKVTVAPVAGMALLLAVAALSRSLPAWRALAKGALAALPLLAVAIVAVPLHAALASARYVADASPETVGEIIERALHILGTMYQMGLIPYDLRLTWDVYEGGALGAIRLAFAVLAILGATWGAWAFAFRRIPEGFGLAAALGATIPVLHLVPFSTWSLASERHLFWPLFGLALVAGSLASRAICRGGNMRAVTTLAVGLAIAACLGLTLQRSLEWYAGPERLVVIENEADPSWGFGALLRIKDELVAERWDVAADTAMRVEDTAQRNMLGAFVRAAQAVTQAKLQRGARSAIVNADRAMLEAEASVRAVLKSGSNPAFAWLLLETHDSLMPLYKDLIALAPEQGAFRYNLALIKKNLRARDEQMEAETLFIQAMETRQLPPAIDANAWDQVAIIRIRGGDLAGARQALTFSMNADPGGYRAAYRLAALETQAGNVEAASTAALRFRERARAAGMDPGEIADRIENVNRIDDITENIIIQ